MDYRNQNKYIRTHLISIQKSDSSSKNLDMSLSKIADSSMSMRRRKTSARLGLSEFQFKESPSKHSLILAKNPMNIGDEEDKKEDHAPGSVKGSQRRKWFNLSPEKGSTTSRADAQPKNKLIEPIKTGPNSIHGDMHDYSDSDEKRTKLAESRSHLAKTHSDQRFEKPVAYSIKTDRLLEHQSQPAEYRLVQTAAGKRRGLQGNTSLSDEEERISLKRSNTSAKTKILMKANKARLEVIKQAYDAIFLFSFPELEAEDFIQEQDPQTESLHMVIKNLKIAESILNEQDADYQYPDDEDLEDEGSFIDNISDKVKKNRPPGQHSDESSQNKAVDLNSSHLRQNPYHFHAIAEEQVHSQNTLTSARKSKSKEGISPLKALNSINVDDLQFGGEEEGQKESSQRNSQIHSKRDPYKSNRSLKPSLSVEGQPISRPGEKKHEVNINKQMISDRLIENLDDASSEEIVEKHFKTKEVVENKDIMMSPALARRINNSYDVPSSSHLQGTRSGSNMIDAKGLKKVIQTIDEHLFDSFVLMKKNSSGSPDSNFKKRDMNKQFTENKIIDVVTNSEPESRKSISEQPSDDIKVPFTNKTYLQVISGLSEINSITKVGHGFGRTVGIPSPNTESSNRKYFLHVISHLISRTNRKNLREAFFSLRHESMLGILPLQIRTNDHSNKKSGIGFAPSERSSLISNSPNTSLLGIDSGLSSIPSNLWRPELHIDPKNIKYLVKCVGWLVYSQKRSAFKYFKKVMARSKNLQRSLLTLKDMFSRATKHRLNVCFHLIHNKSRGADWYKQMKVAQIERLRVLVDQVLNPKFDLQKVGFMTIRQHSQSTMMSIISVKKKHAEYRFLLKIVFGIQSGHVRYSLFQLKAWADFVGSMKQIGKHQQLKSIVESTQRKVTEMLTAQKKESRKEIKKLNLEIGVRSLLHIIVRRYGWKQSKAFSLLKALLETTFTEKSVQVGEEGLIDDDHNWVALSAIFQWIQRSSIGKQRQALYHLRSLVTQRKLSQNTKLLLKQFFLILESRLAANRNHLASVFLLKLTEISARVDKYCRFVDKISLNQRFKSKFCLNQLRINSKEFHRNQAEKGKILVSQMITSQIGKVTQAFLCFTKRDAEIQHRSLIQNMRTATVTEEKKSKSRLLISTAIRLMNNKKKELIGSFQMFSHLHNSALLNKSYQEAKSQLGNYD